jgi:Protein of unknown function (DUF4058)
MPIHDWSRVDANVYHHFHQRWTIAICDALNSGPLPPGYSALVEQHAGSIIPDVLAVQRKTRGKRPSESGGGVLIATPPKTRHVIKLEKETLADLGNRIVIRHRLGEIVCVIEVVSPGNKHSKISLQQFVAKSVDLLRSGVHLLVVDLFPPTSRDPQGIHRAIWDEIEETAFELPTDKPLTLVAYVSGDLVAGLTTTAYVEPVGVGDVLPDMPAYLEWGGYVPVPLEATYQTTWASCPPDMRELVETGKLADEE